jgi:hypothetical protein
MEPKYLKIEEGEFKKKELQKHILSAYSSSFEDQKNIKRSTVSNT